jgi:hypothetical protein
MEPELLISFSAALLSIVAGGLAMLDSFKRKKRNSPTSVMNSEEDASVTLVERDGSTREFHHLSRERLLSVLQALEDADANENAKPSRPEIVE